MSELHIETRGHGDIHLVLLHGWAMHGGVFAPLIRALDDSCTLHVVDLPGHGHSRACGVPLALEPCADAIAAATPPAIWLGWSMGGLIALAAAGRHPDRVRGLAMLCASPCLVRKPDWRHAVSDAIFDQFAEDLDTGFHVTLERFLALEAMGSDQALAESRKLRAQIFAHGEPEPSVLKQGLELLKTADLRDATADLNTPSVWLAGARDRIVPHQAMHWAAQHSGGDFQCVARAGHAPFIGQADAVVAGLQPLLEPVSA